MGRKPATKSDRSMDARNSRRGATGHDNGRKRRGARVERRYLYGIRAEKSGKGYERALFGAVRYYRNGLRLPV